MSLFSERTISTSAASSSDNSRIRSYCVRSWFSAKMRSLIAGLVLAAAQILSCEYDLLCRFVQSGVLYKDSYELPIKPSVCSSLPVLCLWQAERQQK